MTGVISKKKGQETSKNIMQPHYEKDDMHIIPKFFKL